MRKLPSSRWIKQHTIAITNDGKGHGVFPSGLMAIVDGDEAGIVGYACDSYYGCESGIDLDYPDISFQDPHFENFNDYVNSQSSHNPHIDWMWEGTADELFYAAKSCTDLMFPDRKLNEADFDYKDLMALYTKVRGYITKQERKKKKRKLRVDEYKPSKKFDIEW